MSKYTTEVRFICENAYGLTKSQGVNDVDKILDDVVDDIFNFSYPIYDEDYRRILEKKILKHYYTREIGFETVGLWKLHLNRKMNEIMPYYNKLYETELWEFDPMQNYNLTTDHTRDMDGDETHTENMTVNGTSQATSNGTNSSTKWDKYNDTPQGSVGNLDNDSYLSNARKITDSGTTGGSVNNTTTDRTTGSRAKEYDTTETYLEHKIGYAGINPNKLLKDYRDNILNIDLMIIRDLEELFIQLW